MSGLQPPDGTKELIEGVTEAIKQRIGSPLIFGFLASWCVFNYRFLLVIFAEDSFKTKFFYIDKNIDFSLWKPLCAGIIITLLIPLFEIPYRPFRSLCKNIESKWVLWVEKRQPMDVDEQVLAFSEKDNRISNLVQDVAVLHGNISNLTNQNSQKIDEMRRQINNNCLSYLGFGTNLTPSEISSILNGQSNALNSKSELIQSLKNNPMLISIISFVNYAAQLNRVGGYIDIDLNDMRRSISVSDEFWGLLLDLLMSIGFLRQPSNIGNGLWTSPAGTSTYSHAVRILQEAAT